MVAEPLPPVSIVIPVRNEPEAVCDAVTSAQTQEYEGPLEIVVAVAHSADGTLEALNEMASADDRIRVVANQAGSTPAGLNAAIRASNGEIIVRCDAHSVLPPGYVARAVDRLQETGAVNVGGVQAATGSSDTQRAIAAAMSSPFGVGDARFHVGGTAGPVDTVYLGVFRRDAIDSVGLFDESLARNQDYELNHRLRNSGGMVFFDPDLVVEYRPRQSLSGLWRQYHEYGRWKRVVVRRYPKSLRWRQIAPPVLVVALTVSVIIALFGLFRLAAVIPVLYLTTTIAVSTVELLRRKDAAMLLLPVVFPTMHLAWGLGFLRPGQPRTSDS